MRRLGLALAALVVLTPACTPKQLPVHLFDLADERIAESSGIAASSTYSHVFFTHNDSGDTARFFAVGPDGRTIATYDVQGAEAIDWEDMARATVPGREGSFLYVGDIGDNLRRRQDVTVYQLDEPDVDIDRDDVNQSVRPRVVTKLSYEDGPHDAETLFVPSRGQIGVITKELDGRSRVYLAEPYSDNPTLRRVATIDFTKIARPYRITDYAPESRLSATGGDVSPDGRRLVVRTYIEAFEWDISDGLESGLALKPTRVPLPWTRQGEAIGYTRDGNALLTTSEQVPAPVYLVALPG